ncbi:zinc finger protein ZFP2 [Tribolium castaneum]|uniref:zinc finger protein ZFP2 n=1 Tax=Tribolium castaneum TaxID=7070 RepID=UPI0030FE7160
MAILNCPLCCHETFETAATLKNHILTILDNLLCPTCGKKFEKLADLAQHLDDNDCQGGDAPAEGQYYCQMCDLHLDDIDEHLRQSHEGQEILLEEEDADCGEVPLDGTTIFVLNPDEPDLEGDPLTGDSLQVPPLKKSATVGQVDVKDRDGRPYTRKFVKIDKFWMQDDANASEPPNTERLIEISKCDECDMYVPHLDGVYQPHECKKPSNPLEIYICEVCNTNFPTFKSLRLHRRMHEPIKARHADTPANHDEEVRPMFICKICNKTYDKEYEAVHLESHRPENGFNCDICNRKFHTKSNLEMHIKAHSNNKKFTCSYCKKPFVTYDALNEHLLNQCQKRAYACQFCGRRFARPHEKVKHERIHTGEKPHVCEICGKAFRVSYCLTLHMRTHSGTRPYQCTHCGKRFKSHSVYNHHLLTHSDVRAYQCPYCPKAFKTGVQLAGHKNSHTKPFTCTECNRPFASLYSVRAHMESHKTNNNLKYECWMCGALYSRAFALKDHLKQQHEQEGDKGKGESGADEELEAASSILVNEEDIILGLEAAPNIEIIEGEEGV